VILPKVTFSNKSVIRYLDALSRNSLLRSSSLVFLNNITIAVGGMIFWAIVARLYAVDLVGMATAGTSMMVLLGAISQLGLGVGLIRYSSALGPRRSRRIAGIFATTIGVACLSALVFWKLVASVLPGLRPLFGSALDVALFVGACMAWAVSVQFDSYLLSRKYMGLLLANNTIATLLRIVALLVGSYSSPMIVIAITGFSGLVGVISIAGLTLRRRPLPAEISGAGVALRELVAYSFWNYWTTLMATVAALAMPSIIVSVVGTTQAAAYYMAWALFSGLPMIPSALSQALLSLQSSAPGSRMPVSLTGWKTNLLILLLGIAFIPAALLVLAFLGKTYLAYGWLVIVILAAGFLPCYRVLLLQAEIRLIGSQRTMALAYAVSYLASLGSSIFLLPIIGLPGAAIAWTLGQCVLFVWLRATARKSRLMLQSTRLQVARS
jgi:O-antigen/teichoic acid export membrane protein